MLKGGYDIAGSTTEMGWWLVLAQVLSPWDFLIPLGWMMVIESLLQLYSLHHLGTSMKKQISALGLYWPKWMITKSLVF